jgi:hypothetical protein
MTQQQKQELKKAFALLAAYYQTQIRDEVIVMYVEDLGELTFDQAAKALNDWRRNPKNTRMPLPAQIMSLIHPPDDDDSLAREAAARIISAVSKHGYNRPEEARAYIGELGWSVVEKQGGWYTLATSMMEREKPTLQAQYRDLAKSQLILSRQGRLDKPPELPKIENKKGGLQQIGSSVQTVIKKLEK